MDPLLLLAGVTLAAALVISVGLLRGLASLPRLRSAGQPAAFPTVSIVVAARDEAADIAPAIQSMLRQDYPALEVVVVDDRSTDGTGEILDRLAEERDRVRVLHLEELPAGWLGKNFALNEGAAIAGGELLLFTDADVMMEPEAVTRGVALMQDRRLDHLAVAPRILAGSTPATMTVAVFLALFSAYFRPWKARDPDSRRHIGIGSFNLVRADVYREIGGYAAVRLRPDDDVRFGRVVKRAGYRQAAATGADLLAVEWYPTLRAMGRGLRKNAFAVVDYRLPVIAAGTVLPFLFSFWPVAALFVTSGAVWWLNAAVLVTGAVTVFGTSHIHGLPRWPALTYPLAELFLLGIIWAAALRATWRGTVDWRGTEYALDELRG